MTLNMIKTVLADCFEGDKLFALALQDGFAKIKEKIDTMESKVEEKL